VSHVRFSTRARYQARSRPRGVGERYGDAVPKIPMTQRIRRNLATAGLFVACAGCGAARPAGPAAAPASGTDPLEAQTAESLFRKGHESADRGETVRAEQYLELALDKGYDRSRALPVLLSVCLSSGRLRSALNYAEPELRLRPDDAELRYLAASIDLGLGQRDEARDDLEQLLRLAPNQPAALYLLGVVEADDFGEDASARAHFKSYLDAAPCGKHAAEVRNRLSGLGARRAIASNAVSTTPDERMPRYEPYAPSPGVLTKPVTRDLPAAVYLAARGAPSQGAV
jgi:tetratricopeptide (TPR) repeat protein